MKATVLDILEVQIRAFCCSGLGLLIQREYRRLQKVEDGPRTIYAGFLSSLGFGVRENSFFQPPNF